MKAISLWQPWASLWCSPYKVHETRHWYTSVRGLIAVHASKKIVNDCAKELDEICIRAFGQHWRTELPRGALVGTVELVNCEPTEDVYVGYSFPDATQADTDDYLCGDFTAGRYAWRRDIYRRFVQPIPWVGRQGFFNVPAEINLGAIAAMGTGA